MDEIFGASQDQTPTAGHDGPAPGQSMPAWLALASMDGCSIAEICGEVAANRLALAQELKACHGRIDAATAAYAHVESVHSSILSLLSEALEPVGAAAGPWPETAPVVDGEDQHWAALSEAWAGKDGLLKEACAMCVSCLPAPAGTGAVAAPGQWDAVAASAALLSTALLRCDGNWLLLNTAVTEADALITLASQRKLLQPATVEHLVPLGRQLLRVGMLPVTWAHAQLAAAGCDAADPAAAFHAYQATGDAQGCQRVALDTALLQAQVAEGAVSRTAYFAWRSLARMSLLCPAAFGVTQELGGAQAVPGTSLLDLWMGAAGVALQADCLPFQAPPQHPLGQLQWLPLTLQAALQQSARPWFQRAFGAAGPAHELPGATQQAALRHMLGEEGPLPVQAVLAVAFTSSAPADAKEARWVMQRMEHVQGSLLASAAGRALVRDWLTRVAGAAGQQAALRLVAHAASQRQLHLAVLCRPLLVEQIQGPTLAPPVLGCVQGLLETAAGASQHAGAALLLWAAALLRAPTLVCTMLRGHAGLALVAFASGASKPDAGPPLPVLAAILHAVPWAALSKAPPPRHADALCKLLNGLMARAVQRLPTAPPAQQRSLALLLTACLRAGRALASAEQWQVLETAQPAALEAATKAAASLPRATHPDLLSAAVHSYLQAALKGGQAARPAEAHLGDPMAQVLWSSST